MVDEDDIYRGMDPALRALNEEKARRRAEDERRVAAGEITREELQRRNSLFADAPTEGVLERLRRSGQTL